MNRSQKGPPILPRTRAAALLAAGSILAGLVACGRVPARNNIVLVTIESLRADRVLNPPPAIDPLTNLRGLAAPATPRAVLASSSDTLPSLATMFTGLSPAAHQTLVDGIDRLPAGVPTLATLLGAAGYRTAGFPSLTSLGLASGLSRGFQAYGWPPSDLVTTGSLAGTDLQGWVLQAGRRRGDAVVEDALGWVDRHRGEPFFLWVHLAEAAPPYATDPSLIDLFKGSTYDAALAYDDRQFRALYDGVAQRGLEAKTIFVVSGDHGESLGANGETFHGLNLRRAALETAVLIIRPESDRKGKGSEAPGAQGGRAGRLQDLFRTVLDLAGVDPPAGNPSKPGLPPITSANPLFAVTLGPRVAFGWNGRIALFDGEWGWSGPEEAEMHGQDQEQERAENRIHEEPARASALRALALAEAASIAPRLTGRAGIPSLEARQRLLELFRSAASVKEPAQARDTLLEAWRIDPGNFETAKWLGRLREASVPGVDLQAIAREVQVRGAGLPEASLALARIASPGTAESIGALRLACGSGGGGCAVEIALRLAREKKYEEAALVLAPEAARQADADLWRTLGDIYLEAEKPEQAAAAYDNGTALRPSDPDLLLRQGDCLLAMSKSAEAEAKYKTVQKLIPNSSQAELGLGASALQRGDRKGAVRHFKTSLGADTETPEGAIELGRLLAERGMTREAVGLFLEAAAADSTSGDPLYLAAEALAAEGSLEESEKYLNRALEREPTNPMTLYQLARLLAHRGDRAKASGLLEQLAAHASPEIAAAALQDPLFVNDAPGAPLSRGLDALRELAAKKGLAGTGVPLPGGGAASPDSTRPPAGALAPGESGSGAASEPPGSAQP